MRLALNRQQTVCGCSFVSFGRGRRPAVHACASASFSDDSYKYSDHVVYNEQFANAVRSLNRIWNLSSVDKRELRPMVIDGRWLVELVERQFGMRYECVLRVTSDDACGDQAICLYIGPYVFDGRDYEGYLLRMTGIVRRLAECGVDAIEIEKRVSEIDVDFAGSRGDDGEWIVGF